MSRFVLQIGESNNIADISDFVCTTAACIATQNDFYNTNHSMMWAKGLENGIKSYPNDPIIPVGSIEFVEAYMQRDFGKRIQPINIPEQLRVQDFTRREVGVGDRTCVQEFLKVYDKVFVKSHEHLKEFLPTIVSPLTVLTLPENIEFFISEVIELVAEWRVFVWRGNIRDIRPYMLQQWIAPSRRFVESAIKTWKDAPPAYTLDVGITSNKKNVVIEAHPMIACGLYGFDDFSIIPQMTSAAYKTEAGNSLITNNSEHGILSFK